MSHMDCTSIISWESLLRNAVRCNDAESLDCLAIAANGLTADDVLACEPNTLLTLYAQAAPSDIIQYQYSQGPFEPMACDKAEISLSELAASVILTIGNGSTAVFAIEDLPALTLDCDRDCSEEEISTEEMIRRTFVWVSDTEWRVRINVVTGFDEPMNCDMGEVGIESLVRSALVPTGDGGYAWRIIEEAVDGGGFSNGFSNGFDI